MVKVKSTLKVKDMGWERIKRENRKMRNSFTKAGFPQGVRPSAGDAGVKMFTEMNEISVVAAVHEWGAPKRGIPERSFIRSSFDDNLPELIKLRNKLYWQIQQGRMDTKGALFVMGQFLQDRMKQKIRDIKFPPNSPATIAKKGVDNPLIDTAQMINSISHVEVVK